VADHIPLANRPTGSGHQTGQVIACVGNWPPSRL